MNDPKDGALRRALGELEQLVGGGWLPARRELLSRLPAWLPRADVRMTPTEVVVTFALPGVEKNEIRVRVAERAIAITGTRRDDEERGAYSRREQPRGTFARRVRLPSEVEPRTAKASLRDGELRVTISRSRRAAGRCVKLG